MATERIRFGVIGTENSHVNGACASLNINRSVPGGVVEALFPGEGDTLEHVKQVQESGKVPFLAQRFEDLLGKVDAVIIMNRHGKYHTRYAKFFLEKGVPTYVDKPLCCDVREAEEIVALSRRTGTWLASSSDVWKSDSFQSFLRSAPEQLGRIHAAVVAGPADFENEYGGVFFYGIHSVEMLLQGFGYDVETVRARRHGKNCLVTVTMRGGLLAALQFLGENGGSFQLLAHGEKGSRYLPVDSTGAHENGLRMLIEGIRTNTRFLTDDQLVMPVRVLCAIEESARTGAEIRISPGS